MRLFDGLERTDYQDLLRSIGRQLDSAGARDLRLIEGDSGLTIQCRYADALADGFATVRYDEAELLALVQENYGLRGRGTGELPPLTALGISYQRWLRAVGRFLDNTGRHSVRAIERPDGVLLQASSGKLLRGYEARLLTPERLTVLIERSGGDRELGWPD